jgi:hypothetical protein
MCRFILNHFYRLNSIQVVSFNIVISFFILDDINRWFGTSKVLQFKYMFFFILVYFNGYLNAGELFLFNYIFIILDY